MAAARPGTKENIVRGLDNGALDRDREITALAFGNRSKLESREGEKSIENGPMSCDHGSTPRARECVGVLQIRRPVFFRTVVLRTVVVVHVRRKLNLVDEPEMRRRQQGYSGGFFVTALWAVDCCSAVVQASVVTSRSSEPTGEPRPRSCRANACSLVL